MQGTCVVPRLKIDEKPRAAGAGGQSKEVPPEGPRKSRKPLVAEDNFVEAGGCLDGTNARRQGRRCGGASLR